MSVNEWIIVLCVSNLLTGTITGAVVGWLGEYRLARWLERGGDK